MVEKWGRLEHTPFEARRLEEERANDKGKVLTVRLNEEEAALLEHIKKVIDTDSNGTAFKICWLIGWKKLHDDLGDDWLKWLSRRDRSRLYPVKF